MKPFIHEDFLLPTQSARELYHEYAVDEPIFDYHCHLSPKDLVENRSFHNLFEIWLEGDHYKWRAMRLNGVDERFCTGDADPKDKFRAFARTVPHTFRNPIYHWTHLELKRYFGIEELLDEHTADSIWEQANEKLTDPNLSAQGILSKFRVKMVGTTDDPTDTLEYHAKLRDSSCPAEVLPTFRPDRGILTENVENWNSWVDRLSAVCGNDIISFGDYKSCLSQRVDYFDQMGCKASDHGLLRCPLKIGNESEASVVFEKLRSAKSVSSEEREGFAGHVLAYLGELYHSKNWVMQLHLGAARNMNAAIFKQLGPDTGCDSIADVPQVDSLALLLGELSLRQRLPKTVLYNLNPRDNYAFATMCGNFFQKDVPCKVHYGSGWWFLDQWEGMMMQLNALSSLSLLSHFIGMITDSRSFMSYPRHEYFRRLLCNLLGEDLENGALPEQMKLQVGEMVRRICFQNASDYFQLSVS